MFPDQSDFEYGKDFFLILSTNIIIINVILICILTCVHVTEYATESTI